MHEDYKNTIHVSLCMSRPVSARGYVPKSIFHALYAHHDLWAMSQRARGSSNMKPRHVMEGRFHVFGIKA